MNRFAWGFVAGAGAAAGVMFGAKVARSVLSARAAMHRLNTAVSSWRVIVREAQGRKQ